MDRKQYCASDQQVKVESVNTLGYLFSISFVICHVTIYTARWLVIVGLLGLVNKTRQQLMLGL